MNRRVWPLGKRLGIGLARADGCLDFPLRSVVESLACCGGVLRLRVT